MNGPRARGVRRWSLVPPAVACGRRLAGAAATLLAASAVLFAAAEVLPGDAAASALGGSATAGQLTQLRAQLGLDRPLVVRYADWIGAALGGDLGRSTADGRPVRAIIAGPLADTLLLVGLCAALTVLLALAVGLAAGLRPGGRLDRVLSGGAVVLVSLPQFVTAGILVLVCASWLGVLPAVSLVPFGASPLARPEVLVLPVAALTLFSAAWASRMVRAAVADAAAAPHVAAARLAGLSERRVVVRHLLPTAAGPCAQVFGWLAGALVGGTAVVEQVFNYPGLSRELVAAVEHHDSAVLEGVGLLMAAAVVGGLVLADLVGMAVDPRLRRAR
ncbi:ABC transporter permease [Streptomyces sp. CB02959]|uniref:ABC transporter permease n=1 Tax=Streptomyces sp. CB02959 TaxID=2020330 RepID=UPI000C2795D8|nr:ABC transporter permease [Streptomyces sp. CB02959]PJN39967.1 ABC transporter permease [Streptomyces sp. CB02959]